MTGHRRSADAALRLFLHQPLTGLRCCASLCVELRADSMRPPYRFKTTYLLYATTALGWLAGGVIGRTLYSDPNAKPSKASARR